MIDATGLTRHFDGRTAVDGLSFRVAPGEILGLVGPNGAGKTTTLRCLAGILRPTAGRVSIAGHDLAADAVEARRRLGFVPDEPQLFDDLTVEEHLRFTARLYGVADGAARIEAALAGAGLADRRRAFPTELSRGMRQQLALACALLPAPAALLLDEPLTGLDPAAIRAVKDRIRAHAAAGGAVLLSSHLLHLVEELGTRVLLIDGGRAVVEGTLGEIAAGRPGLEGRGLEAVFLAWTR